MHDEHWFDRLAAPQTRATVVKSAAAAAILALPFAAAARGALASTRRSSGCSVKKDPKTCAQPCNLTADAHYLQTVNHTCQSLAHQVGYLALTNLILSPVAAVIAMGGSTAYAAAKCQELALMNEKAAKFDCLQPACPSFDPCDPLGPCAFALAAGKACCPTSAPNTSGYATCDCCAENGDGCKQGVGPC